jgi:hypothetical protein
MALAIDLYLARVKFASDCANVVSKINGGDMLGPYGQLILKITAIKLDFECFEFTHKRRWSNAPRNRILPRFINKVTTPIQRVQVPSTKSKQNKVC